MKEEKTFRPKGFIEVKGGSSDINTVEWYTPPEIFESLNIEFDIDVAAPVGGVSYIPAKKYYTKENDGLKQDWEGNVWMNPPYGKYTENWLEKFINHNQGIALVFSRTDTLWFHNLVTKADAILFTKGRLCFYKNGIKPEKTERAANGSLLIACGKSNCEALKNSGMGWYIEL
jgi:phage N-6-adenine-methyltransferase|tara:strand:- start:621 stop:1139 length:519 start_codon:yes stop_codon:yes gene_type:complete